MIMDTYANPGIQVKCQKCNRQANLYTTKGIETVIVAYEPASANQLWVTWEGWHKAICGNCLASLCH